MEEGARQSRTVSADEHLETWALDRMVSTAVEATAGAAEVIIRSAAAAAPHTASERRFSSAASMHRSVSAANIAAKKRSQTCTGQVHMCG